MSEDNLNLEDLDVPTSSYNRIRRIISRLPRRNLLLEQRATINLMRKILEKPPEVQNRFLEKFEEYARDYSQFTKQANRAYRRILEEAPQTISEHRERLRQQEPSSNIVRQVEYIGGNVVTDSMRQMELLNTEIEDPLTPGMKRMALLDTVADNGLTPEMERIAQLDTIIDEPPTPEIKRIPQLEPVEDSSLTPPPQRTPSDSSIDVLQENRSIEIPPPTGEAEEAEEDEMEEGSASSSPIGGVYVDPHPSHSISQLGYEESKTTPEPEETEDEESEGEWREESPKQFQRLLKGYRGVKGIKGYFNKKETVQKHREQTLRELLEGIRKRRAEKQIIDEETESISGPSTFEDTETDSVSSPPEVEESPIEEKDEPDDPLKLLRQFIKERPKQNDLMQDLSEEPTESIDEELTEGMNEMPIVDEIMDSPKVIKAVLKKFPGLKINLPSLPEKYVSNKRAQQLLNKWQEIQQKVYNKNLEPENDFEEEHWSVSEIGEPTAKSISLDPSISPGSPKSIEYSPSDHTITFSFSKKPSSDSFSSISSYHIPMSYEPSISANISTNLDTSVPFMSGLVSSVAPPSFSLSPSTIILKPTIKKGIAKTSIKPKTSKIIHRPQAPIKHLDPLLIPYIRQFLYRKRRNAGKKKYKTKRNY